MTHLRNVTTSNIVSKFREAFETYTPGVRWQETKGSGDIIITDGNCVGSAYLVISKDPLTADTYSTLESIETFNMPIDLSVGVHLSQRTLGQEFSVELISGNLNLPSGFPISSISQNTTTLTINTTAGHTLKPGMRIGVSGVTDSRLNYPALVVATIPSTGQITATAGPGGTITSLTVGPFNNVGSMFVRSPLGGAVNGTSMIFENATATNASYYARTSNGDALPSGTLNGNHSVTILSTASTQSINAANAYAFNPTDEYRLVLMVDNLQWSDVAINSTGASNNRFKQTNIIPSDGDNDYKIRFRATNNPSLTTPVAQIVSVSKAGSTTATVTTDVPHGLTTSDLINTYGVRDTTNFANLTSATAVASIVSPTQFTVIWGASVTATSYGGYVSRVNGGQNQQGAITQVAQSASRTENIVTVIGSATWSGLSIGDYINLVGVRDNVSGATLNLDGSYRVRNLVTTTLEAEPIGVAPTGANIASTNCGGGVIKRTDLRISFVRMFDFERQRIEVTPRPSGDESASMPVRINGTPAITLSGTSNSVQGAAAHDAGIAANPVRIGARALTADYTAVANGDTADLKTTLNGALIVKLDQIPENTWSYPSTGSLPNNAAAVTIKTAAAAGIRNYLKTAQISTSVLTNSTDLVIRDGSGGAVLWRTQLQTTGLPLTSLTFDPPLRGTAATLMEASLVTPTTGNINFNAQGYIAS